MPMPSDAPDGEPLADEADLLLPEADAPLRRVA